MKLLNSRAVVMYLQYPESSFLLVERCWWMGITTYNEDHSILYFEVGDGKGGTLENFYLKPKEGSLFFWDLTDKYKEAYPQVTKVELVWAAAQHF